LCDNFVGYVDEYWRALKHMVPKIYMIKVNICKNIVCLFFTGFCVCDETNIIRCLLINQTVFYITGFTKKLSL